MHIEFERIFISPAYNFFGRLGKPAEVARYLVAPARFASLLLGAFALNFDCLDTACQHLNL